MVEGVKESKANGTGERATLVLGENIERCPVLALFGYCCLWAPRSPCRRAFPAQLSIQVTQTCCKIWLEIPTWICPLSEPLSTPVSPMLLFLCFLSPVVPSFSFEVSHARLQQDAVDPGSRGGAGGEASNGYAARSVETVFDWGKFVERKDSLSWVGEKPLNTFIFSPTSKTTNTSKINFGTFQAHFARANPRSRWPKYQRGKAWRGNRHGVLDAWCAWKWRGFFRTKHVSCWDMRTTKQWYQLGSARVHVVLFSKKKIPLLWGCQPRRNTGNQNNHSHQD